LAGVSKNKKEQLSSPTTIVYLIQG